jgi:hypothetical protein
MDIRGGAMSPLLEPEKSMLSLIVLTLSAIKAQRAAA